MGTLVGLKIFYLFLYKNFMFNRFLTRVLTSISILLLLFIVNSICSVIVNIKERISKIK